jgi:cell pole-organizing protein PopZ
MSAEQSPAKRASVVTKEFGMARQPNPQDVSVDEIIASIRRIVADDDHSNASTAADNAPAASPPVGNAAGFRSRNLMDDILNFPRVNVGGVFDPSTESQQAHVAASQETEGKRSEQTVAEPQPLPPAVARDTDAEVKPLRRRKSKTSAPRATEHALLSRTAAAAVEREFEALSRVVSGSWNARLEAMAREMMRPMLRVWLDRHLPKLVRQLVREEIARMSGTSR